MIISAGRMKDVEVYDTQTNIVALLSHLIACIADLRDIHKVFRNPESKSYGML